jgi:hypothetical protein
MIDQLYTSDLDEYMEVETVEFQDGELCGRVINGETFPKILNINIRSINRNFEMLEVLLHELKIGFDAIVLTECWLNRDTIQREIEGYTVHHSQRHYNQNDGIVIYIRRELSVLIEEPDEVADANCLVAKIENSQAKIIAIYRSPSFSDPTPFVDSIAGILKPDSNITVITGDMNIDILNHGSTATQRYLNMMAMHGFQSAINKPTRGDACLDHIMIRTNGNIRAVVYQSAITDHYPVMAGVVTGKVRDDPIRVKFTKFNRERYMEAIRGERWEQVYASTDVNESCNAFEMRLRQHISESKISDVRCRRAGERRKIKEWITPGILKCLKKRDRLHRIANERTYNRQLSDYYKRYRNICSKVVKKARELYFAKRIESDGRKSKECWKIMREFLNIKGSTKSFKSLVESNNKQQVQEELNRINSYFGTNDEDMRMSQPLSPNASAGEPVSSFFAFPADITEVIAVLGRLKRDTSPGIDEVNTEMFQMVKEHIAPPISHIFNLSIEQGRFPESAKIALLVPIHKKGDTREVSNYRPISLLTTLSKILEKLMKARLVDFLERFRILSENQFGFRNGKNTEGAIMRLTHFISQNLDNGKKCIGVFMDLAKAFDTVPHHRLLQKLNRVGVRGRLNDWFGSYLSNRKQVIRYNDILSEELTITKGVPQGSILGPVLFLVYINDLCNASLNKGEIITFADDTVLLFRGESWEEVVRNSQDGFDTVAEWMRHNLLTLNAGKTNYVCFSINKRTTPGPDSTKIVYHRCRGTEVLQRGCSCQSLERRDVVSYLGVAVDENLCWRQHVIGLTKRIRKLIYIFRQLRSVVPVEQLRMVYYALCYSLVGYAIMGWGGAARTILDPLYIAQKLVIKVAYGLSYMHPTLSLFRETQLLSVRQVFIHKIVMNEVENGIEGRTRSREGVSTRGQTADVPRCRTTFCQRFPNYLGPKLYNTVKNGIGNGIMRGRSVKEFLQERGVAESEEFVSGRIV